MKQSDFSTGRKVIRADGDRRPIVLAQMDDYRKQLTQRTAELEASYRRVCENLSHLDQRSRQTPQKGVRSQYCNTLWRTHLQLDIDTEPCLLIVGFTEEQRNSPIWQKHERKLIRHLGEDRLLMVADTNSSSYSNSPQRDTGL